MPKSTKPVVKVKAKVMWANLFKENEMSGKFQVDLCNLDSEAVRAIESLGVDVKQSPTKADKGFFITCKSLYPILTVDTSGNKLEDILVGNGTEVTALVSYYDWNFKNKRGRSPSPVKLVIDNLVEYNPDAVPEEDDVL